MSLLNSEEAARKLRLLPYYRQPLPQDLLLCFTLSLARSLAPI
jgi:hypothetical protein